MVMEDDGLLLHNRDSNACDRRDGDGDGCDRHSYRIEAVMLCDKRYGDGDGHCHKIEVCNACDGRQWRW